MGGGGGGRSSLRHLKDLLEKARAEIRRSEEQGRRNVFLSFAFEDLDSVNLLRGQARNENTDLEFNDWSVREPYESARAAYIKQKIAERIQQSSLTVVYLSASAARSKWVEWEVEESRRRGKPVVGVFAGQVPPAPLPGFVAKLGISVTPWSRLAETISKLN